MMPLQGGGQLFLRQTAAGTRQSAATPVSFSARHGPSGPSQGQISRHLQIFSLARQRKIRALRLSAPLSATYQSIAVFTTLPSKAKQPSQRRCSFQWQNLITEESSCPFLDFHARQHTVKKSPKCLYPGTWNLSS
jgi:hypothetical protein